MMNLLKLTKNMALTVAFASLISTNVVAQASYTDNSSEDYLMTSNYEAVKAGWTDSKTVLMLDFSEYNRKDEYSTSCLHMIEAFLDDDGQKFTSIADSLIKQFPDKWQAYFWKGYYNESRFRFIDAINNYIEALKLNPNSWVLNKNIGRAYMGKAILSAGKTLETNNVDSEAKFLLMFILKNDAYEQFTEELFANAAIAHTYFVNAIDIYEADSVNTRANIEEILDTYNKAAVTTQNTYEALAYYNKVISYEGRKVDPLFKDALKSIYVDAYAGAGDCYLKFRQYDKALFMYKQGCKVDKNSEALKELKRRIDMVKARN